MTERMTDEQINAFLSMAADRDRIVADRNGPLWGLFLMMESALSELRQRRDWEKRSAEFDATDAADPAWWRGHDYTIEKACEVWQNALDGDPLLGTFSNGKLTQLYRRTLEIVTK